MKVKLWAMMIVGAFAASAGALRADEPKLEVHEWGTFTVLSGSDGAALQWYQPGADLELLPEFVGGGNIFIGGKAAYIPAIVRMETPVLYFYPEKQTKVKVEVSFAGGRLTEWFPLPVQFKGGNVIWSGQLLPPDDAAGLQRIPQVQTRGNHYRHAREVPEAWIFQGDASQTFAPGTPAVKDKDADKFIFYRGTGDAVPPYVVRVNDQRRVELLHHGEGDGIDVAFALSVEGDQARWSRLPRLDATNREEPVSFSAGIHISLEKPSVPLTQAETELRAAMVGELDRAGLTQAEARAMVATWEGNWFREPGTRVLAIMPRKYVDAVLPLTITPKPHKVERVFVARFETLAPAREEALLALLGQDASQKPDKAHADAFANLQLGRFGFGALKRAQTIETGRMMARFADLRRMILAPVSATAAR